MFWGALKLILSNFFRQKKLGPTTTWQQTRLKQISKQGTSSLNWKQKLRRTVTSQPQGKLEGMYFCTLYRMYQKKGNRTLQCSSGFIIQSTEIILSQAERPGF